MSDLTINLHLAAMLLLLLGWERFPVSWDRTDAVWQGCARHSGRVLLDPRWASVPGTKVVFVGSRAPCRSLLPAAP